MNQRNIAKISKVATSASPSSGQSSPLQTRLYKGSIDCGIQVNETNMTAAAAGGLMIMKMFGIQSRVADGISLITSCFFFFAFFSDCPK